MTDQPRAEPNDENSGLFQDLTSGSVVLLIFACLGVLEVAALFAYQPATNENARRADALPAMLALVPHLLIVSTLSMGFRELGDYMAIAVGSMILLLASLYALVSGSGTAVTLALLQLPLILLGFTEISARKNLHSRPIPLSRRGFGLLVPLAVGALGYGIFLTAAMKGEHAQTLVDAKEKRKQLALFESSQIANLFAIAKCIEQWRGDSVPGPYPGSIRELFPWSSMYTGPSPYCQPLLVRTPDAATRGLSGHTRERDTVTYISPRDVHHLVYYQPPATFGGRRSQSDGFTLEIAAVWDSLEFPEAAGRPGTHSLLLDSIGSVHVTRDHRRATVTDPVLPQCAQGDRASADSAECRPSFGPRDRWGLITSASPAK
jgi:hypothetical protein